MQWGTPAGCGYGWHDGGGPDAPPCGHRAGPQVGEYPNKGISVLYGLGTWEAGRSGGGGGMDPQRGGRSRAGEEVGRQQQ